MCQLRVDAAPFTFTNGYTIAFDNNYTVGVTLIKMLLKQLPGKPGALQPSRKTRSRKLF